MTRAPATIAATVLAVALASAALSCGAAVRHPAITTGITAALIGLGACEVQGTDTTTCLEIGGVAGAALGGIAAIVLLLAPPSDQQVLSTEPPLPVMKVPQELPDTRLPVPVATPIDAGVDAVVDAAVAAADAAVPVDAAVTADADPYGL
jgi:hypothetical protein